MFGYGDTNMSIFYKRRSLWLISILCVTLLAISIILFIKEETAGIVQVENDTINKTRKESVAEKFYLEFQNATIISNNNEVLKDIDNVCLDLVICGGIEYSFSENEIARLKEDIEHILTMCHINLDNNSSYILKCIIEGHISKNPEYDIYYQCWLELYAPIYIVRKNIMKGSLCCWSTYRITTFAKMNGLLGGSLLDLLQIFAGEHYSVNHANK